MPFCSRIGVAISLTLSIVNARAIGLQKWTSALVAKATLAQLGLEEEGDLERRRRALVRHRGDPDDDLAAVERVESAAQPGGRLGAVEVVGLGLEVLDRLGQDARAGGQDELRVGQALAVGELDELSGLVDPGDLTDDERRRACRAAIAPAARALRPARRPWRCT